MQRLVPMVFIGALLSNGCAATPYAGVWVADRELAPPTAGGAGRLILDPVEGDPGPAEAETAAYGEAPDWKVEGLTGGEWQLWLEQGGPVQVREGAGGQGPGLGDDPLPDLEETSSGVAGFGMGIDVPLGSGQAIGPVVHGRVQYRMDAESEEPIRLANQNAGLKYTFLYTDDYHFYVRADAGPVWNREAAVVEDAGMPDGYNIGAGIGADYTLGDRLGVSFGVTYRYFGADDVPGDHWIAGGLGLRYEF